MGVAVDRIGNELAIGDSPLARVGPVALVETLFDEIDVAVFGIEAAPDPGPDVDRTQIAEFGELAEHAVARVDHLVVERRPQGEFPAEIGKAAVRARHLEVAKRRSDRLRRQRGSCQQKWLQRQRAACRVEDSDAGARIARTEGIDAVEIHVGAAVPELANIEDCIDDGRRIPRLDFSGQQASSILAGYPDMELVDWSRGALFRLIESFSYPHAFATAT